MPYHLLNGETEAEALRRCATEQLDRAIEELTSGVKDDPATAVHTARKALKKERSLLRLARGSLKGSDRRAANAALRDAGRRLSDARDAEVMIQTVDGLAEHYAGQLPKRTFTAVKRHLNKQTQHAQVSPTETQDVAEELKAVRAGIDGWRLRRNGWAAVGEGLSRSYRRGRHAYRRAERKPTAENLHEWRKRAKDLWYHVRVLEPVSPGVMRGMAKEAHRLSDLLGDDHDLAVLRQALLAGGAAVPTDLGSVLTLIEHRREQLEAEAMQAGARLYAEKPKAFARRIRRYAKVWRAEPAIEADPVELPGRVAAA